MDKPRRDLLVFGYGLGTIAAIFAVGGTLRHGFALPSKVLLACSVVFVLTTALAPDALRPGYQGWMKVAQVIGTVVTTIILGVVFFGLFAPIGLLFRLIGKDHLERKFDPLARTYWQERPADVFDKERYHQQF